MFSRKYFTNFRNVRNSLCCIRNKICHRKFTSRKKNANENQKEDINLTLGEIGTKYQVFRDTDSRVIPDVYEGRLKYSNLLEDEPQTLDPFFGINLQRGINGVFEIKDLVEVLKRDNAENLFVAAVPPNIKYVDYICVVTAKSYRHMLAISQFVRRVYKLKKHKNEIVPRLEGEDSKEWMALDLGNIALHIFSRDGRLKYDLDSLWSVGPDFDRECNKQDPVVDMLERHSIYLKDLQPAS